jgi:hypothetical protein
MNRTRQLIWLVLVPRSISSWTLLSMVNHFHGGSMTTVNRTTRHIAFRLCPNCLRAVTEASGEHFCTNCGVPICSPEAGFYGQGLAIEKASN